MKTWFRRVRHLTRYVSSILKLISSIISASSRWNASRKKSQKGWDNFSKKISKIFKCLCFKRTILELISQDYNDGIPGFPDKMDAASNNVQDYHRIITDSVYSLRENHKIFHNFLDIRVIICQNIRFQSDGYLEQIDEFISAPPMIY